jgi:hypothetical protein
MKEDYYIQRYLCMISPYSYMINILFIYFVLLVIQLLILKDLIINVITDYVLWLDLFFFLYASYIMRVIYFDARQTKSELMNRLGLVGLSGKEYDEKDKKLEKYIVDIAFNPNYQLIFGFLGGFTVSLIMYYVNVLHDYPYLLFNFLFGFNNGIFIPVAIGGLLLSRNASKNYIKTVDILDPDGMGGFRKFSELFVDVTTMGILFITFDFLIISSAFTRSTDIFKLIVVICLLITILGGIFFLFSSLYIVRKSLLKHRNIKMELIREEYRKIENRFWDKMSKDKDVSSEAVSIPIMSQMFEQMRGMTMWPIDLYMMVKLGIAVITSVSLIALQFFIEKFLTSLM